MKRVCKVISALLILGSFNVLAEAPPQQFDKKSFLYKLVQKTVFDVDAQFKQLGMNVYSCQVFTNNQTLSYRSFGNCLFKAAGNTFKTKQPTKIKLWLLNDQGQYLEPLSINWKSSQKNWFTFAYEFIYLSAENLFKHFTKSNKNDNPCEISADDFLNKDLGNFLGEIEIKTAKPWKLSDYMTNIQWLSSFDLKNANDLRLNVKTPEVSNGKRVYEGQVSLQNTYGYEQKDEGVLIIKIRTNYNLVAQRDACVKGHMDLLKSTQPQRLP
ncbi:MAG: hypothetical protein KDD45_14455 [Bdellovibrionales bacterium]|nr:hypothetical protein [Bdellovibrionales bacterium]